MHIQQNHSANLNGKIESTKIGKESGIERERERHSENHISSMKHKLLFLLNLACEIIPTVIVLVLAFFPSSCHLKRWDFCYC